MVSSVADLKYPSPPEAAHSEPFQQFAPYFPHIVDPALLMDNWKLLTDEQIRQIKNDLKDEPLGRHSKDKCKLPYGIIKGSQGYFAIYRVPQQQVELAQGRNGKTSIKVVQHLETGEWYLLKTSKSHDLRAAQTELEALLKLGRTKEPTIFTRRSKKTDTLKYEYLMKLEKGFDLSHILDANHKHYLNDSPELLRLYILKLVNHAYKELRTRCNAPH